LALSCYWSTYNYSGNHTSLFLLRSKIPIPTYVGLFRVSVSLILCTATIFSLIQDFGWYISRFWWQFQQFIFIAQVGRLPSCEYFPLYFQIRNYSSIWISLFRMNFSLVFFSEYWNQCIVSTKDIDWLILILVTILNRDTTVNFDSGGRICFCCSKLESIYALDRLKYYIYPWLFGNILTAYI